MVKPAVALNKYASHARRKIPGWLSRIDAEIIKTILLYQNENDLNGGVAEIGVHHGKCFVELCLALKGNERAYAIDIFENQKFNKDASGEGSRQEFIKNLRSFEVSLENVVVDARPSQDVKTSEVLSEVGQVRIFSVDGGHWLDVVRSDLSLAESTLADYGVIALDDFHRPEWPDVSAGYFSWYSERGRPFIPIAIGFNKLYIAHQDWAIKYRSALEDNRFLRSFASKRSAFQGHHLLVYQRYLVPELPLRNIAQVLMMTLTPNLYYWVKRLARRRDFSTSELG